MLFILSKENISISQKKAIAYWTSTSRALYYQGIKRACENKYNGCSHEVNENHIKWFNSLESLFNEYEDNTKEYEVIYRADIIDNKYGENLSNEQIFDKFCEEHKEDKIFQFDDMICSFSASELAAYHTATKNKKYKSHTTPRVMYILEKRFSKYLYIAEYTENSEEKEVLKFGKQSYQVVEQNINDNNYVKLSIIEIEQ